VIVPMSMTRSGRLNDSALLLVLVAIFVASCGQPKQQKPADPEVTVASPLPRNVVDWDDYVGRFEAVQNVEVRPQISGTVQQIAFREGGDVRKGQLLFVIDDRSYRSTLAQAEAQIMRASATLGNANTELARARELREFDAISKEEFEKKQAAVKTANADVSANQSVAANARLNLSFTRIYAPISGRVSDKRVALGDFVTEGQTTLTRIVTVDPIYFSFEGAESFYLKYVRQDARGERESSRYAQNPVEIQLADESGYRWKGRMVFVDSGIDRQSGTVRAKASVANPGGFLVPGLFGRLRILGSGSYAALLVPDESIVTDQDRKIVFVVNKANKVEPRVVGTGPSIEGLRVIRSGISATDRIILDGLVRLRPGTLVKPKLGKIEPRAESTSPIATPVTAPPAAEAKPAQ
jgi:RND family efflux transporter MFP subunit